MYQSLRIILLLRGHPKQAFAGTNYRQRLTHCVPLNHTAQEPGFNTGNEFNIKHTQ